MFNIPGTAEENMERVWGNITEYFSTDAAHTTSKYGYIKLSTFTNPDAPLMKHPMLKGKGAEVKSLVPALAHVWKLYMQAGNPQHESIACGLDMSSTIDQVLEANRNEWKLEGDALGTFQRAVCIFLHMQNELGYYYPLHEGLSLFNVTQKSHYLMHSALQAEYINPRLCWCFGGEDFMHASKQIAHQACQASPAALAGEKTVQQYCIGLHLQLCTEALWRA